jgi:hypothetical protein
MLTRTFESGVAVAKKFANDSKTGIDFGNSANDFGNVREERLRGHAGAVRAFSQYSVYVEHALPKKRNVLRNPCWRPPNMTVL